MGDDEDPVPPVRGADGLRGDAVPFRIEPARGQLSENGTEPPASLSRKESWYVLQDDVSRSHHANDSHELEEQAGSAGVDAGLLAGDAEVLTGEAPADEVDRSESFKALLRDRCDVAEVQNAGPVLRQYPARVGIDLRLTDDGHARSLKAEVEPADPAEQGEDSHDGLDAGPRSVTSIA